MKQRIVCAKAGRDKGNFMVVVEERENYVLLCDGKSHPLSKPKLKNIKHVSPTNSVVTQEQLKTDKSLKTALKEFKAKAD